MRESRIQMCGDGQRKMQSGAETEGAEMLTFFLLFFLCATMVAAGREAGDDVEGMRKAG